VPRHRSLGEDARMQDSRPTTTSRMPAFVRLRARDPHEPHRTATPLELLFDLTFVVAIAALVAQLAHAIVDGHPLEGVIGYLAVFFAIWWAWMNFTWFASAFDRDDAFYRVLTMVQMAGVLVLAAGVEPAFSTSDYSTAVVGYVIMRIALVIQWLRVASTIPEYRATALRFAIGITAVQSLWVVRLVLPDPWAILGFVVIGLLDLAVPLWAERVRMTPWHPHHIAERYGLFTIIVLGESVLAATTAVVMSKTEGGTTIELTVIAIAALVLLFSLWWLYFLEPAAPHLEEHRELGFLWGYGHYVVFAALAAVGAGIEVGVEAITHDIEATTLGVAYALAIPVAIYLAVLWLLHVRLGGAIGYSLALLIGEVVIILAIPLATAFLPIHLVIAGIALAAAALVAIKSAVRSDPATVPIGS
jgi:low temperature requirement protein LtrA